MLSTFKTTKIVNNNTVPLVSCGEGTAFSATGDGFSPKAHIMGENQSCFVFPGFIDVHVHLREPGFFYKETVKSGTLASAAGGYTAVCSMPNLDPVPDCANNMDRQLEIIKKDALINVYPYAAITVGQKGECLSDMDALKDKCIAFSDDGRGVENEELMLAAMKKAKSLNKMIVAHCEDLSLVNGGVAHDGAFARKFSLKPNPSSSEWMPIKRDIELIKKTGCKYHVCHVSSKESVELIRQAKKDGLDITCETAPHYLLLDDSMLKNEGRFKMNPPIRAYEDRMALLEGIADGTIDMIATDHAPHSASEKAGDFTNTLNGIVGIETAFPLLYTGLVKTGNMSLEKLIELMHYAPKKRFGIETGDDYTVFDLSKEYTIDPNKFLSMGKSTPFEDFKVYGMCLLTSVNGRTVWQREN